MTIEIEKECIRKNIELPGLRYYFVALGFLGVAVNYAVRVTLNVAIVAMVNATAVYNREEHIVSAEGCNLPTNITISSDAEIRKSIKDGEFVWFPKQQGIILGAFYYGYILLQVSGGRMAEMYSGKWVYGLGTLIPSLLSLLIPTAAHLHYLALVALCALQGLVQGVIFPSYYAMMSNWFPDCERGFFLDITMRGCAAGILCSMTLTGFLCNSETFGGWPSAFYVMGSFGCIWFFVWSLAVTDAPSSHPMITQNELNYILSNQRKSIKQQLPPFPWLKILGSVPFWSVAICAIGSDWGATIILSELPTFMATILHFDIEKNGLFSSLIYILGLIPIVGPITDLMIRKKILSLQNLRKGSAGMSLIVSSVFLLGVSLYGCNVTVCIACLISYNVLTTFVVSGHGQSSLNLSPEYAGTLFGILNSLSSSTGFIAPYFVGSLTQEHQTMKQWQIIFGVSAVIQAVCGLIFILFSTTEKQNWAEIKNINSQTHLMAFS